jgi:sugar transferase (PEP-CTERM/EpsH1 system associated)
MKILFITSRLPYPPYRGDKLKIFNLIRRLSARHEIGLVSLIQNPAEEQHIQALSQWCSFVHLVHLPRWRSLANCLAAIPRSVPFQVAYYKSGIFRQSILEACASFSPDIIHSHLIRTVPYTVDLRMAPRVLDLTDAVSLYLQRFVDQERNPMKRALIRMELGRIRRYEPVIAEFDRALVCSDVDQALLQKLAPAARVGLLYNGVDLDSFSERPEIVPDGNRIIFTGNMTYFPNVDAALYLARDIFPRIARRVPDAKLFIVGQNPPAKILALQSNSVTVTGFVEDIGAEYAKSAVAVSPVRFGAGTLNKVLEPLALGVPVVSTSIGILGLGLEAGVDLEVSDATGDFADRVAALLLDPARGREMGRKAAIKVRERFSWDKVARELEKYYEEATETFRSPSDGPRGPEGYRSEPDMKGITHAFHE